MDNVGPGLFLGRRVACCGRWEGVRGSDWHPGGQGRLGEGPQGAGTQH